MSNCPPFELPVRYKCSISKDKNGRIWANLLILDAKEKVIEQIASQCKPSTGTLTASLEHIQENYKYIVAIINSHEKLVDALQELVNIVDGIDEGIDYTIDSLTTQPAKQALKEAEKP